MENPELEAERGRRLLEEGSEIVLVLDDQDRLIVASRRAREAQGRGREYPRADRRRPVPERARDGPRGRLARLDRGGPDRSRGDGRAVRARLEGGSDSEGRAGRPGAGPAQAADAARRDREP